MWITEYNLDHQDLPTTQSFFNTSAEYFDRLEFVERYSLFGAFRADVSNDGANGAMLSAGGNLTDIGSWYLGREATGVLPTQGSSKSSAAGLRALIPHAAVAAFTALSAFAVLS